MEELSARPDVGAVLLTGAGEKAFIAGADISVMKGFSTLEALDFSLLGQRVLAFIESMRSRSSRDQRLRAGRGCESRWRATC